MKKLKVGTLINDNDKLGVIAKVIEVGTLDVEVDIIKWRANYEIHYIDGIVSVLGCSTVSRLISEGKIEIVYSPATPLPSSSSSKEVLREYVHAKQKKKRKKTGRKKCGNKKQKKDQ